MKYYKDNKSHLTYIAKSSELGMGLKPDDEIPSCPLLNAGFVPTNAQVSNIDVNDTSTSYSSKFKNNE